MKFSYRSPFEGHEALIREDIAQGWCVWFYQGVGVTMPVPSDQWPDGLKAWYSARRDANLMGSCPVCGAMMPVVMANLGFQRGNMTHDDICPLIDPAWLATYEFWAQA